jgi:hypothetical protein
MNEDPEIYGGESPGTGKRFDKQAAEQILRRAADEQARLDVEEDDSYSLEQLQEIATEAGISPEAVRAAARAHEASTTPSVVGPPPEGAEPATGWLAAIERRLPASWSPRLRRGVVVAAGVTLVGLLVAVAGVGPVVIALSVAIVVLVLLFALLGLGPV